MKEIGLETNLAKLCINKNNIDTIIKNGFNPQRMKNNPKIIYKSDLEKLLTIIL